MSASQTRKRSSNQQPAQSIGATISESAKRQVGEVRDVAKDAVVSGTWAYPLLGILYLVSHPSLIKPLLPTIFKGVLLSLGIVAAMFFFTYLPQVAVLAFISGPLAFIAAIPLVLGEAYFVVMFFTRGFLIGPASIDLFDAVLLQKGCSELVERGRQVTTSGGKTKQLGAILTKPLSRFSTDNIVRYVLTLPLNFVPVVGTAFFLGFNGYKSGPGFHARYFQLKGFDKDRRNASIKKRRGAYTAFGTICMVLGLVPVVSIFFTFTNQVGAALWAADLEKQYKGSPADALKNSSSRHQNQDEVEVVMPAEGSDQDQSKKEL